jgi:hypothetical protein
MKRLLGISGLGLIVLLAALVIAATIPIAPPDATIDVGFSVFLLAGLILYWGLGALIVMRVDGHAVGWLFAIAAAMMSSAFGGWAVAGVAAANDPSSPVAGWAMLLGIVLFTPGIILTLPAIAIAFPTGTLPGPGWRWPVRLVVVLVAIQTLAYLLRPGPLELGIDNPLTPWLPALSSSQLEVFGALGMLGNLSILLAAGIGLAAVIVRFRRAQGDQRLQLKWFLAAMTPAVVLLLLSLSEVFADNTFIDIVSVAMLPIVAVSIALAILRYRLYDIDRIISRTIAYGLVTALLVAVFLLVNLGLQWLLSSFTSVNSLAVAGSTLLVAALFTPVRRRVQRIVDRRFDRARYDGERTASEFSARMRDAIDLPTLTHDLDATVREAIAPSRLDLWLRGSDR